MEINFIRCRGVFEPSKLVGERVIFTSAYFYFQLCPVITKFLSTGSRICLVRPADSMQEYVIFADPRNRYFVTPLMVPKLNFLL